MELTARRSCESESQAGTGVGGRGLFSACLMCPRPQSTAVRFSKQPRTQNPCPRVYRGAGARAGGGGGGGAALCKQPPWHADERGRSPPGCPGPPASPPVPAVLSSVLGPLRPPPPQCPCAEGGGPGGPSSTSTGPSVSPVGVRAEHERPSGSQGLGLGHQYVPVPGSWVPVCPSAGSGHPSMSQCQGLGSQCVPVQDQRIPVRPSARAMCPSARSAHPSTSQCWVLGSQ